MNLLIQGQIQREGAGGATPPPEMKPSSYLLLKFVYLTSQLHHSLSGAPCPQKTPGSTPEFFNINLSL